MLIVHNEEGYNLLQKCVGINNLEMVRWILSRNPDLNRGACSFPLHIACLKGYFLLYKINYFPIEGTFFNIAKF